MVMRNYVLATGKFAGTGHVTFVYGKTAGGDIAGLGGNQKDSIKISEYATTGDSARFKLKKVPMAQRFHAFYIPATYAEYAKQAGELATVNAVDVNKNLLKIKNAGVSKNESGR